MSLSTLAVAGIIFFASLVRSTFGFGEALVAVPLLTLFLPVELAVPLAVLMSVTIAAVIIVQDHDHIHFASARGLVLWALPGIGVGLLMLSYLPEGPVKLGLGAVVAGYSTMSLWRAGAEAGVHPTPRKWWLPVCGFLSGVMGGSYGLSGPPLVIYGRASGWSAGRFRATLQAYFLPASAIAMVGYWWQGLWDRDVNRFFIISLPGAMLAVWMGRHANRRLAGSGFFRYVYALLICVGTILMVQAARKLL